MRPIPRVALVVYRTTTQAVVRVCSTATSGTCAGIGRTTIRFTSSGGSAALRTFCPVTRSLGQPVVPELAWPATVEPPTAPTTVPLSAPTSQSIYAGDRYSLRLLPLQHPHRQVRPTNKNLPIQGENISGTGVNSALVVPVDYGAPTFNVADLNVTNPTAGPNNAQASGSQYGAGLNVNRCNCPTIQREDQFQLVNNWTKLIGNHAVKVGADLRYARNLRVPSDNDRTGINKL